MLSATVPRKSVGRCGTQAICVRQAAASQAARSTDPASRRPRVGLREAEEERGDRALAAPLVADEGDRLAGPELEIDAVEDGARRAGYENETASSRTGSDARARRRRVPGGARRPVLEQVEEAARDGEPVGARVVLRREVPERQVELGREHEHRQARLEAEPALDEPDADDHGDERDAEGRGELEHGSRRGTRRGASPSSRGGSSSPTSAIRSACASAAVERAERRQPADDVEEVGREARERLPALARPPLGVPADEPHEDRDERQRQEHEARGDGVDRRDEGEHGDRARPSRARPAAGSARRPSRARRRLPTATVATSALCAPSSAAGRSRSRRSTRSSRSCESTSVAARRPATSNPHAVAARATATATSSDQRPADVRERGAVERARGDACEQHRLGEDEQRGDDPERRRPRRGGRAPARARRRRRGSIARTGA